ADVAGGLPATAPTVTGSGYEHIVVSLQEK
ncbi:unnamed protein product, partial [marine sediment metagenome]